MPAQTSNVIHLDARPAKRFLLNRAKAYAPDVALYEFIDNAIDRWKDQQPARPLSVDLEFEFEHDICHRIRIRDNAGGVPMDRLHALVKVGTENPTRTSIGIWGEGLKVGAFALARRVVFRSRFQNGPTYRIEWPDSWWDSEDWTVPAYTEPPDRGLPEGSFEVILTVLRQPWRRGEVFGGTKGNRDPLTQRLGRVYAPLLGSATETPISLTLRESSGDEVPVQADPFGDAGQFEAIFAFPPGYEPTRHRYHLDDERELTLELVAGLLPEQSRDRSGVTMYGNGRLFALALKEGSIGFGTRGPAKIPASHPTTWRLVVLAYFEGPADKIPWSAPAKDAYKESNPYAEQIRERIQAVALPYATFTKVAKRLDLLPYSQLWNQFTATERLQEVRQFCGSDEGVPRFLEAHPHLSSDFQPMPLRLVDHTKAIDKTSQIPSLSIETSRAIARRLRKRDPANPLDLWSDKTLDVDEVTPRSRADPDPWKTQRQVTVRIPQATARLIEERGGANVATWIAEAIDRHAGRIDGLWRVPQIEFRPVLEAIRSRVQSEIENVQGIAVFGSVARGDADRESDIDLLVGHKDRLPVQQRLNREFGEFRFPVGVGERYRVKCQAIAPATLAKNIETGDPGFHEMMREAIWLFRSPPFVVPTADPEGSPASPEEPEAAEKGPPEPKASWKDLAKGDNQG